MNGLQVEVALGRVGEAIARAERERAARLAPARPGWLGRLRGLLLAR